MSASVLGIIIIMANIFFVKIDSCNPAPFTNIPVTQCLSVSVCLCGKGDGGAFKCHRMIAPSTYIVDNVPEMRRIYVLGSVVVSGTTTTS